jgi:hypothetical protein
MSLRSRLIIAFLLLSVAPLSAVTLFSYASSVNAVENAAVLHRVDEAVRAFRARTEPFDDATLMALRLQA